MKEDSLPDDIFDPNLNPAQSYLDLNQHGLHDDNFDPNFDLAQSYFNWNQDGLPC